jgi:hypothetical protein
MQAVDGKAATSCDPGENQRCLLKPAHGMHRVSAAVDSQTHVVLAVHVHMQYCSCTRVTAAVLIVWTALHVYDACTGCVTHHRTTALTGCAPAAPVCHAGYLAALWCPHGPMLLAQFHLGPHTTTQCQLSCQMGPQRHKDSITCQQAACSVLARLRVEDFLIVDVAFVRCVIFMLVSWPAYVICPVHVMCSCV